jgi:NADP-dependent 3-hydroxy acid dehydrogenase YdfG
MIWILVKPEDPIPLLESNDIAEIVISVLSMPQNIEVQLEKEILTIIFF